MDIFSELAAVTRQQHRDGDLPDFIVPLLLGIAARPQDFAGREELIVRLLNQVREYETYSELCCEKLGYSLEDIHRTLDLLRVSY